MRKHKLTWNGMGMTFESEAFFNQPLGNYGARNGFRNCYCAVEVNYNVKKEGYIESHVGIILCGADRF